MRGHVRKRGATWTVTYDEGRDRPREARTATPGGAATRREAQRFLTDMLSRIGDAVLRGAGEDDAIGGFLAAEWPTRDRGDRAAAPDGDAIRARSFAAGFVPRIGHLRLQTVSGGHLNALLPRARRRRALHLGTVCVDPCAAPPRAESTPSSRASWHATPPMLRNSSASPSSRAAGLDRPRTATVPRPCARRPSVRALAARGHDRDAPRRAPRREAGSRLDLRWAPGSSSHRQLVPTIGGPTFGPPKSRRSRRTVALDAETVDVLRAHRETHMLERAVAGDLYQDHDLDVRDRARQAARASRPLGEVPQTPS